MKKQLLFFGLLAFVLAGLLAAPIQANFVLCPGADCNATQGASEDGDLINGSPITDFIIGLGGDDFIFSGDGNDAAHGFGGNDLIFGGLGSDILYGDNGNDILMTGPDQPGFTQSVGGMNGNDTINILVGETTTCWFGNGLGGNDVVNLVGFGPYAAIAPFGQADFEFGWVHLVDPIAGGDILIFVTENGDGGTETINGLLTPNPTILPLENEIFDTCTSLLPDIPGQFPQP